MTPEQEVGREDFLRNLQDDRHVRKAAQVKAEREGRHDDAGTAARLLRMLWKNFTADQGLCDLTDRLEAGERVTAGMLRELAERWERKAANGGGP
jgi:hypothetical protein